MSQTASTASKAAGGAGSSAVAGVLGTAARKFAAAQGQNLLDRVGDGVTNLTDRLDDVAENGGQLGTLSDGLKRTAEGENPAKAALGAVGSSVKDKVKSAFGGGGGKGGTPKATVIIEEVDIGVPLSTVYDQWTQFEEFSSFMKGVVSVEQKDDVETHWRGKVAKSSRTWTATIQEQIPDRRIVWTSEGAKGSVNGVVTFHPLADDLTKVLVVLEYYPSGFFEKTANIWRAPGRRARLDIKHFRRYLMTEGEATGSWRGEIRDGEVVSQPGDEEDAESEDERDAYEDEDRDEERDEEYDEERDAAEDEEAEEEEEEEEEPAEEEPRGQRTRSAQRRRAPARR
ncbi:MAG: SRPBCC family protein [Actinomycetes bacterium]